MKIIGSSIFRAICAIIIGVMLLRTPDSTVTWITVAIGALFFISGAISCLDYLSKLRQSRTAKTIDANGREVNQARPFLPIVGIGSMILGAILALTPTAFISSLMYVLAAVIIVGALSQMYALVSARQYGALSAGYWVLPILLLLAGIFNSFSIYRQRKKSFKNLPFDEGEYVEFTEEKEDEDKDKNTPAVQ